MEFDKIQYDNIGQELIKFADKVTKILKDYANEHKHTGKLERSVKYVINGTKLTVKISKVYEFVTKGTRPHKINPEWVKRWSDKKGLDYKKVAHKIMKFGTKKYPHPEFDWEILTDNLRKHIEETYKKDIEIYINKQFPNAKKKK